MSIDYTAFKELHALLASGQSQAAMASLRGLQAHVIALHDEVDRLHARIGHFEEVFSISSRLTTRDGFIWLDADDGAVGPFCPDCHEAEGSLIRLKEHFGVWTCPCCTARFDTEGVRQGKTRILQFQPNLQS